ncbi:MAG: hypothetical protein ACE5OZ_15780 [Candidatus Heimdallarchaeota archaeon]
MSEQPSDEIWDGDDLNHEETSDSPPDSPADPLSPAEETISEPEEPEVTIGDAPAVELEHEEMEEDKEPIKKVAFGKFLRKHVFDATLLFIVLLSLIAIIILSKELVPDSEEVNPDDIIGYETNTHLMLVLLSILAFWLILIVFSRILFSNRGKEFGIEEWSPVRKASFFIITLIFVSSVYMLFDVAVINSFLLMGSNTIIWSVKNDYFPDITILTEITSNTDRLSYAQIRAITFTLFYITLLIFPVTMFLVILTRMGRARLLSPKMGKMKYAILKKVFRKAFKYVTIVGVILIPVFVIILALPANAILFLAFLLLMGLAAIGIIFGVIYSVFKMFDVAKWMLMSNLLILAPIVFVFVVFPVFTWTLWDMYLILDTGTLNDTIYTLQDVSFLTADTPSDYDLEKMDLGEQIAFFGNTFYFNLFAWQRILMMDFVIIVGLAALIIGVAEGYSIVAILSTMVKRPSHVVQDSPPQMVVLTTRLVLLSAWLLLVWDNFLTIWQELLPRFNISVPDIDAPGVFDVIQELAANIMDVDVLIPLALLIIPIYFIGSSALKFFSVTLVSERIKKDANLIFLLTSSAYVLIVTAIFGDIAAMPEFTTGAHKPYLPLSDTPILVLLPDIIDLIEMILAVSFYLGVIIALLVFLRFATNKILKRENTAA